MGIIFGEIGLVRKLGKAAGSFRRPRALNRTAPLLPCGSRRQPGAPVGLGQAHRSEAVTLSSPLSDGPWSVPPVRLRVPAPACEEPAQRRTPLSASFLGRWRLGPGQQCEPQPHSQTPTQVLPGPPRVPQEAGPRVRRPPSRGRPPAPSRAERRGALRAGELPGPHRSRARAGAGQPQGQGHESG